eukprot:TRINITY_DN9066_c0_g2_i1.p1 TRINITY_DN9066_c0_g2~~TRINITY_DN9066_c0_g2_i1.p1  ORF type:complete len:245 (-),score=12.44 TRINITY_DN9066_c0_g2_i1:61-795(-)
MLSFRSIKYIQSYQQICGVLFKICGEQGYLNRSIRQHQLNSAEVASQDEEVDCWHCGKNLGELKSFFCGSCKGVQPARLKSSYYEVMGIHQIGFNIDLQQLDKRYKALQLLLHPDKFEIKSSKEREYSLQQASLVNNAYNTLKNPLARAKYLCNLYGWPNQLDDEGTMEDPELLMQIMEERERLEETEDQQQLLDMRQSNTQKQQQLTSQLTLAFQKEQREEIRKLIIELTYIVRLGEQILEKI